MVEAARFSLAAMTWHEIPDVRPLEISSRSENDNRRRDRGTFRGFKPPLLISGLCTDLAEQPTALAASAYRLSCADKTLQLNTIRGRQAKIRTRSTTHNATPKMAIRPYFCRLGSAITT
jgi:hypothetical protein